MDYFTPETCSGIKNFLSKVKNRINNGWIFRGHTQDDWKLRHSFERACTRFNIAAERRKQIEYNMIREFKRRLHHYTSNTPAPGATGEWLSLMQHYGAPTRLLDFTYSPYIAAYFAFESAKAHSNVIIWAVQDRWFANRLKVISKDLYTKYDTYRRLREENENLFDDIFIRDDPIKLILPVNPFRLNERLAYQRGVFLCPGDISISFEENFSAFGKPEVVAKHVIKYSIETGSENENTIEALDYLDIMNITRITLFPGLDGFAQSFENRIKSLFDRQFYGEDSRWLLK